MASQRYTKCIWLLIWVFVATLFVASLDHARAGSRGRDVAGAAAAGLAIGLILGGAASQGQPQDSPEGRTYRNCASIFGPGAVNAASNPGRCVCRAGYMWASEGGSRRCVPRDAGTAQGPTRSMNTGNSSAHSRAEVEKIQESLNLLGYDAGSVDGAVGQKTQQAILRFQADKQFPQTGNLSAAEQQMLFKAVEDKRVAEAARWQQPVPPPPPNVDQDRSIAKPDPRMELAHWETVKNSKVAGELEDYIERYKHGEFAKLASLRLEQVKAQNAREEEERRLKFHRVEPSKDESRSAQLPPIDDAAYPTAKQRRADAVAVIIGNNAYRNGVPSVDYSVRDAEAMKLMAVKTIGLDSRNIMFLKDATRGAMDEVFGTDKDHKGKLWRLIDPDGRSDVYIFYSGHGVPGVNASDGNFLLPVDGDPNHASLNGYPLRQLYENLGKLTTRSTTVFLDACFSGQSPDASSTPLIKHASPVFITKATPSDPSKISVFAAASDKQLSSWDPEAGHGIFTRYVLAGLAGEADEDKNKEVTAKELHEYVSRQVRKTARRAHGREQEPWFTGNNPAFVLSSF